MADERSPGKIGEPGFSLEGGYYHEARFVSRHLRCPAARDPRGAGPDPCGGQGWTKPRIAVLEFKNKADNQWWYHGGAAAAQDVFVTELVKSGKFRVVEREQLEALMKEKGLTLSGDVDPKTAVRVGKLLGVNYLLTGAVTEYGNTDVSGGGGGVFAGKRKFVAALNARLIDTSTGEIAWADEASQEESSVRVSVVRRRRRRATTTGCSTRS